jgi:hypothetical protein
MAVNNKFKNVSQRFQNLHLFTKTKPNTLPAKYHQE